MKQRYELIIFDCDGTLVDSEKLTNRLIATMINEIGIPVDTESCLDLFAGKTISHITSYIKEQGVTINDQEFESSYRSRCTDLFHGELQAIPGVEELLMSLKVPYCIASNGPKKKMNVTLPASGLDKYFTEETVFSAYDIKKWKPEPTLFLHAAKQMNVHASKCLVIEDTWSGVMGAVNAKIDVLAYNPHRDARMYLDGVPNYCKMTDIQNFIEV